jgi:hypothetical protein
MPPPGCAALARVAAAKFDRVYRHDMGDSFAVEQKHIESEIRHMRHAFSSNTNGARYRRADTKAFKLMSMGWLQLDE